MKAYECLKGLKESPKDTETAKASVASASANKNKVKIFKLIPPIIISILTKVL